MPMKETGVYLSKQDSTFGIPKGKAPRNILGALS